MRFLGLVVALVGLAAGYFLGYRGMTFNQMRTRLAQLFNLPGLAPPTVSGTMTRGGSSGTQTTAGGSGQSGFTNPGAGQGVAGGGGGSW